MEPIPQNPAPQQEIGPSQDRKYYELLEFAPDAFFQGDAKGNLILVNSKAISLSGYSREELLQMNLRDLFTDSQLNQSPLRYDLLNAGKTVIIEREIQTKAGEIRQIEMSSKQNADGTYQCFMRDITERVLQAQALLEIEQRYRLAFQTSPDAVTINDINGRYVDVNQGFCDITGYQKEEILGKNSIELGIWTDAEDRKQMVGLLKTHGYVKNFEAQFRRKDGSMIVALMSSNIIQIHGEPHVLAVTKEITQMKAIEQELRVAKDIAEQNDRLKSAFLTNLSHEIRTPMNGILGFAELLRYPDVDFNTRQEYLEVIMDSGKHLLSVINDIIEIAKIETRQITPNITSIDVGELLAEISRLIHIPAQLQGKVVLEIQKTPLQINTDRIKLQQILMNLLTNAVKFTDYGSIKVSYEWKNNDLLSIRVTDTGIGIPEEYQHLVFERFRQIPNDRNITAGGSGLGLSICKAYVELLGGWIGFNSSPGEGTTFHFTIKHFPLRKPEQNTGKVHSNGASAIIPMISGSEKFKILVVEDNDVNFKLMSHLLSGWGFEHERAVTGQEAIDACRKNGFHLVLMDIHLPQMSGTEAMKHIKAIHPTLPVVAQTAHVLPEEIEAIYQAGFHAYLPKPIHHSTLLRTIHNLM